MPVAMARAKKRSDHDAARGPPPAAAGADSAVAAAARAAHAMQEHAESAAAAAAPAQGYAHDGEPVTAAALLETARWITGS